MSAYRYLRLYPRAWRERYGDEVGTLLEGQPVGLRTRIDLVRGAIDAHLHPAVRSRLPVLAAVTTSALAVAHAIALAAQPVATEWPGYLYDALPLILGSVAATIPTVLGLWLKLGDADGPFGRLGMLIAVIGHVAWLIALLGALAQLAYGPLTAAAMTLAMAGIALLGIGLAGRGRIVLGALLAAAGLAGLAPPAWGWAAYGAAWTGVALALVLETPRGPLVTGPTSIA